MNETYERLGVFYLGQDADPEAVLQGESQTETGDFYLLRSKDLLTHALCVGMTGSGKTGVCTALLEEAAIDGIPAILVDLKGDLANLALSFNPLTGEALEPWVRATDAENAGQTKEQFAAEEARKWNERLAQDTQTSERVDLWRENSELVIYTPGLSTVRPLSILESFQLPEDKTLADEEALTDLATGSATALLALIGMQADPLSDREHILLSRILLTLWKEGYSLRLEELIQMVQNPPFDRLGMMPLDDFFPEKERFQLALKLNKLLAAPSFNGWLEGEPLDIDRLLYNKDGKAKISILSLVHLDEAERSFFLTLLLNQLLAWSRRQKGTQALRALFYMDEIQGYFPPVAEPPTKKPLMTLLKQARAFGLGMVLATQNPVDLDYKGLSNIGYWMIGRLQTDRDRSKVMEGLKAAAAQGSSGEELVALNDLIAALPKRHFLVKNIHREGLALFRSRQTLSYLAGPLNREELQRLPQIHADKADPAATELRGKRVSDFGEPQRPTDEFQSAATHSAPLGTSEQAAQTAPPSLRHDTPSDTRSAPAARTLDKIPSSTYRQMKAQIPDGIPSYVLPITGTREPTHYAPALYALSEVFFEDKKNGVRREVKRAHITPIRDGVLPVDWADSRTTELQPDQLLQRGDSSLSYDALPEAAKDGKNYTQWSKDLVDYLYRNATYTILENKKFKEVAEPDETARDFAIRLRDELREEREKALADFEAKYKNKIQSLDRKILTAEQRVEREEQQAKDAKQATLISFGNAVLSTLFGKKKLSTGNIGKAATAGRSATRARSQSTDVARAEEKLASVEQEKEDLLADIQDGLEALGEQFDRDIEAITERELRPLKRDCKVTLIALVWEPLA